MKMGSALGRSNYLLAAPLQLMKQPITRGEDTRYKFTDYLYNALIEKGIRTFRDDDEIEGGQRVMTKLIKAIEESKCSVIVISKNYASSTWCLNELVKILECEKLGQMIYAIFYEVDPSDVRKHAGEFGKGFSQAVSKDPPSADKWRKALVDIAGLKGWVYDSNGNMFEKKFIDDFVKHILEKLNDTCPNPLEGLVGIESRMDKVKKLLDLGSNKARIVGIWGMGGMGKTTIAEAVYKSIYGEFEGCCFLENVREVVKESGLKTLQEQLVSKILKIKDYKVDSVIDGANTIRNRVCHKKVLIVLDDLDGSIELEKLIGKLDWFSNGSSRIIITTRNRRMLIRLGVTDVYEVQELDIYESKELFVSKAFEKDMEVGEFQSLIDLAIEYAKGTPLALKVLGSSLLNLNVAQWESALNTLKESPDPKVQEVLRISYDGLRKKEKKIFLDICCFFRGKDRDEVVNFLDACGFNPVYGISVLVEKCLLTISDSDKVGMHDLVQEMGRTIVRDESEDPGRRSRLWDYDDIKHVLMNNTEILGYD